MQSKASRESSSSLQTSVRVMTSDVSHVTLISTAFNLSRTLAKHKI